MTRKRKHDDTRGDAPRESRDDQQQQQQQQRQGAADARRESGMPGGGRGRRDEVGGSGVHPMSAGADPKRNAELRTPAAWGQGERGAAGYEDSGGSELVMRDGQLLGGLTAGPSGEPTIDIHSGEAPGNDEEEPQSP